MKKILIINDFQRGGGAETVCNLLARGLEQSGNFRVTFFTSESASLIRTPASYIFNVSAAKKLQRVLLLEEPDIVWVHNFYHILSPAVLWALRRYKKSRDIKVFYTAHDFHLISPNPVLMYFEKGKVVRVPPDADWLTIFYRVKDSRGGAYSALKKTQWLLAYRILRLHSVFDCVFCPSSFLLGYLKRHYPRLNVFLLRNPLSDELAAVDYELRLEKKDSIKLLFLGRLSPEKGLFELLDCLSSEDLLTVDSITIVGDGPERTRLEAVVKNRCLEDKVRFLAAVPNDVALRMVAESDALFLPALSYENAPMAIVEAAMMGKPVIVNDFGSMSTFGREVGNSIFYQEGDKRSLLNAFGVLSEGGCYQVRLAQFSFAKVLDAVCSRIG